MDSWLAERLAAVAPTDTEDRGTALARVSAAAASVGVTGWTDATPERTDGDARTLVGAFVSGAIRQRLQLMLPRAATRAAIAEMEAAGVRPGPVKILLDDPSLPALDEFAALIAGAHRQRRAVAVHCVTRVQLLLTMAALDQAGSRPGDRIEHGALIPGDVIRPLAASGLTVVTQPNFVIERGDEYLADVPEVDQADLWRGQSLVAAGVAVAAGTDAPFGSPDPWLAIRAAVRRLTASGRRLGQREAVAPDTALGWWTGSGASPAEPRCLSAGAPADLVVLDGPWSEALAGDGPVPVVATVIAGQLVC
jgi:hypothetical protein